ncbi:ATP-binding cassette domain-containing protein [Nonomuraea phyllanthi]|uniref:ATP-binding cassette domain-containing protein n=1 Tax=Nonomuraea phyllanthi TaxID=2219224 RepID=A0A5C4WM36_9ACTN|nr:ABC transporter ATP-binding protein [Nonomuraea phyllanthi]KAB8194649.1 ATP-binding cassette domain-containing protein [Nonomuraea phyllanthi]
MSLRAHDVTWTAQGRPVIDGVTVEIPPGGHTALLGPNGSGKSTFLRLLAGLLRPEGGTVLLSGHDLHRLPRRAVARRMAVVAQEVSSEVEMTVLDVVLLGRIPHHRRLAAVAGEEDLTYARRALGRCGAAELEQRRWPTLSGGERQRVNIARALAQEPTELLLDEPTNHLDIAHQLALLDLLAAIPVTVVTALHDLNLAARYCDHLLLLHRGRLVAAGPPEQVLTGETVERVYGVRAEITTSPTGRPGLHFLGPSLRAPSL